MAAAKGVDGHPKEDLAVKVVDIATHMKHVIEHWAAEYFKDEDYDDDEDYEGNTTETANISPDRSEELYKKTNEELKTILKSHGLPTKGAKSDLVERIVSGGL